MEPVPFAAPLQTKGILLYMLLIPYYMGTEVQVDTGGIDVGIVMNPYYRKLL